MDKKNIDHLTGLYVQKYFEKRLKEELSRTKRYKRPLTLLLFQINYNHFMPDHHIRWAMVYSILRQFGKILYNELRDVDILGRYGGEQFAIIMPETNIEGGKIVAERIRRKVAEYPFEGATTTSEVFVALDGGMVTYPIHGKTFEEIISSAKDSLSIAQKRGGNMIVISPRILYNNDGIPITKESDNL